MRKLQNGESYVGDVVFVYLFVSEISSDVLALKVLDFASDLFVADISTQNLLFLLLVQFEIRNLVKTRTLNVFFFSFFL